MTPSMLLVAFDQLKVFTPERYQEWCYCERKNWSNGLFTFNNAESDSAYIPVIGIYDWNLTLQCEMFCIAIRF